MSNYTIDGHGRPIMHPDQKLRLDCIEIAMNNIDQFEDGVKATDIADDLFHYVRTGKVKEPETDPDRCPMCKMSLYEHDVLKEEVIVDGRKGMKFIGWGCPVATVEEERQSNLVDHARHELELLGEEPSTVEGYLKMIRIFADMGHSGGSASVFIPTLQELLWFKNLCPLTDNPDEWQCIDGDSMWQNRRNGEAFSNDGGKHYYLLSDGGNSRNPTPQYESMHYLGSYEKTFECLRSKEV